MCRHSSASRSPAARLVAVYRPWSGPVRNCPRWAAPRPAQQFLPQPTVAEGPRSVSGRETMRPQPSTRKTLLGTLAFTVGTWAVPARVRSSGRLAHQVAGQDQGHRSIRSAGKPTGAICRLSVGTTADALTRPGKTGPEIRTCRRVDSGTSQSLVSSGNWITAHRKSVPAPPRRGIGPWRRPGRCRWLPGLRL